MSRGGRGGGNQTMRTVATALGIARHEMSSFQPKQIFEPPPLYPALNRHVMPMDGNPEALQFMADLKQEIYDEFRRSEFFLDKEEKGEVHRYIDKYNKLERDKFVPDFSRIPDELCWVKDMPEGKVKRKKLDEAELMQKKLKRLEEKESGEVDGEEDEEDSSDESEKSEGVNAEDVSEDEGEEDNDYISTYFDNGEGYGDGGSDDNMDGDEF